MSAPNTYDEFGRPVPAREARTAALVRLEAQSGQAANEEHEYLPPEYVIVRGVRESVRFRGKPLGVDRRGSGYYVQFGEGPAPHVELIIIDYEQDLDYGFCHVDHGEEDLIAQKLFRDGDRELALVVASVFGIDPVYDLCDVCDVCELACELIRHARA